MSRPTDKGPRDFIRAMIEGDLDSGKYEGRVVTRFPPEPNGYLHIGHAKSICLNFGVAEQYGGHCNLRFDDTNPTTEDPEYVQSIMDDIRWLGFEWGDSELYASDYFERLYEFALELIERGAAYVDSSSEAEIREFRGTITEPGRESSWRERGVGENLDLFRRMRSGEFEDGAHVLRAKIDMAAANMKMRDPLLYRIRHAHHYRAGNDWCIYPMYDFAHCLSDAIENITHSLCTLEFENNREIYEWVLAHASVDRPPPEQTEFARLNLSYTVVSKRKLLELVEGGVVDGWDDPRMPTLSGLRRRGCTPAAIRNFCDTIGVAKANSLVDVAQLEHAVRDDLNHTAPRLLVVLRPLRVVITNYPEGRTEQLEAPYFPAGIDGEGSRSLPFSHELLIERDDFSEDPPEGFRRLAPGREVRLRYAYFIRCDRVIKDDTGRITELHCTYDPETRGGEAPNGRKVASTLHWVSAHHAQPIEVRLYDRLFNASNPSGAKGEPDFRKFLNLDSLEILDDARAEPSLADFGPGSHVQFERLGFFYHDPKISDGDRPVFNRTVGLRDTWARRIEGRGSGEPAAKPPPESREEATPVVRPFTAEEREASDRYMTAHGLSRDDAERLAQDPSAGDFFDAAIAVHDNASGIANWLLNELRGELKGAKDRTLEPAHLAQLVALIDTGRISGRIAKQVLVEMLSRGGPPEEIVERLALDQIADPETLSEAIEEVLAAHPEQVAAYRAGKAALKGFFVGEVMRLTRGRAKPQAVQRLLDRRLADGQPRESKS